MSTISFTTNSDPWGRCFCDFEGAEVNVFFVHIFSLIPLQVHHLESLISVNLRGSAVSSWEKQVDWMFNDNKHRFFSLFSRFFALVWSKVNSTDKSMWQKHEGDWPLFFPLWWSKKRLFDLPLSFITWRKLLFLLHAYQNASESSAKNNQNLLSRPISDTKM